MATPPINTVGTYKVRSPFTIDSGLTYICEAINGFEALESRDINVYETYYVPNGLNKDAFEADRNVAVDIVTLMCDDGPTIYIPSSYIASFPSGTVVPYNRAIISIDLGLVPDNLDVTALKTELNTTAGDYTGTSPLSALHVMPVTSPVTYADHVSLEAARRAKIKYTRTTEAELKDALAKLEEYENHIARLESLIRDRLTT